MSRVQQMKSGKKKVKSDSFSRAEIDALRQYCRDRELNSSVDYRKFKLKRSK